MKSSGNNVVARRSEKQSASARASTFLEASDGKHADVPATEEAIRTSCDFIVLELTIRNDPGVLSQICGVFAWRRFRLHSLHCLPTDDGSQSRLCLRVADDEKLTQTICQLEKLVDVHDVRRWERAREVNGHMGAFFGEER